MRGSKTRRAPKPTLDEKWERPQSIAEARRQIERTFDENRWDRRDRTAFAVILGIEPKELSGYAPDEIRAIHRRMVANGMILLE